MIFVAARANSQNLPAAAVKLSLLQRPSKPVSAPFLTRKHPHKLKLLKNLCSQQTFMYHS